MDKQAHWQHVYKTKAATEVSWTQRTPLTSLGMIKSVNVAKDTPIIDVGGGDSRLVDALLDRGYTNITVLDISQEALDKVKSRLGDKADQVTWVCADITEFKPKQQYGLWHDRAVFHFLTSSEDVETYYKLVESAVLPKGYIAMGTFSMSGPEKCSGLPVTRYSGSSLKHVFNGAFEQLKSFTDLHTTPFNTTQHFLFGIFQKR